VPDVCKELAELLSTVQRPGDFYQLLGLNRKERERELTDAFNRQSRSQKLHAAGGLLYATTQEASGVEAHACRTRRSESPHVARLPLRIKESARGSGPVRRIGETLQAMSVAPAKRRVLGVVPRRQQFGARGVREDERKSKGVKQARAGGFRERGQRGNCVLLKRKHVYGVRGPRCVRSGAGIGSESGLPVGRCRHQTKAAIQLPSPSKESADRRRSHALHEVSRGNTEIAGIARNRVLPELGVRHHARRKCHESQAEPQTIRFLLTLVREE
jgi:hypothetical protein